MKLVETARQHLASPRVTAIAALVGVALCLPSLWVGFVGDDYHHRSLLTGAPGFPDLAEHPLNLFSFLDGDVERNRLLKEYGLLPWWVWEDIRAAMWRPVASALHWLDYRLWPDSAPLMHAHSLLWYAALIVVAGAVYRRLIDGAWIAGLATVLFAVDHVHGLPVGWIANRNTLIATFFGLMTLLLHDRVRRFRGRVVAPWALVTFALGMLSAEAAVATGALLVAYALRLDPGTVKDRVLSLVPYGALVALWRVVYSTLGYGVSAGRLGRRAAVHRSRPGPAALPDRRRRPRPDPPARRVDRTTDRGVALPLAVAAPRPVADRAGRRRRSRRRPPAAATPGSGGAVLGDRHARSDGAHLRDVSDGSPAVLRQLRLDGADGAVPRMGRGIEDRGRRRAFAQASLGAGHCGGPGGAAPGPGAAAARAAQLEPGRPPR
jgi:hypothetical protein